MHFARLQIINICKRDINCITTAAMDIISGYFIYIVKIRRWHTTCSVYIVIYYFYNGRRNKRWCENSMFYYFLFVADITY